ncbi:S8 family peptidase [Chryseolinea sp. Jin1]|uniref:S8 family peptidase n=2 Tax=Chryseolinea lacunae TaxID=2801331 RepID=A0ABS1L0A7_9BACT|nr:S8 family peptidase [Chryseolinea lacunae]
MVFAGLTAQDVWATQHTRTEPDTTTVPKDWFLRDPGSDHVQGLSVEKAYATLLQGKPSKTVVVAVIDTGIDIEHEDLKDVIWTNEDEIPGNGIDDDKNGYVDDIHGWNFIGGKNGNVENDTYEVTREYVRLKPKYENIDEKKIGKKNKAEYELWKRVKAKYDRDLKANKDQYDQYSQQYQLYMNAYGTLNFCDSTLRARGDGKPLTKASLTALDGSNDTVRFAKETLLRVLKEADDNANVTEFLDELEEYLKQLKEGVDHYSVAVDYGYNQTFNSRDIVGDNPNDVNEKNYGNNDVEGPYARHGTHIAGVIGANRKNNLGIKGIADNVRIMSVRALPNGDERDKDVANAIRYAVDNGAQVVNMSFGKKFSPNKEIVDAAVKYAASKGVLLVHAAGNDGDDLDVEANFPTRTLLKGGEVKSWLEIGASSWGDNENFVASFSNYGKKSVDVFAPGVEIYSTIPGNGYEDLQGTSMACPTVVGVAALLFSYYPDLTADQVKTILSQSTRKFDHLKVTKPGTTDEVTVSQLSITGGLINAYEALKLAESWKASTPK